MTTVRMFGLTSVSIGALLGTPALARQAAEPVQRAPVAQEAQTAPITAAATAQDEGDAIIVTGTRTPGRTRLASAAPVDVLSGASLQRQGTTELGAALAAVAPSIDFPRPRQSMAPTRSARRRCAACRPTRRWC